MLSDVSVVIPAHGASPYIVQTLDSILCSTVHPEEIIIIDDGLVDEAQIQIRNFFPRLRIRVIKCEGQGLVDALNTGLRAARFKYICRIDGDDLMIAERIEIQINFLNSNPTVVAVGSQCNLIDSENLVVGKTSYPTGCVSNLDSFSYMCLLAHPSTMYLREAARLIGGYRKMFSWMETDIGEDFDFWLRLRSQGAIFNLGECLTSYRVHEKQISSLYTSAQYVAAAYIAAGNISKLGNQNFRKIEFSGKDSLNELSRFYSVLKDSPFMVHRISSRLQIQNLLQESDHRSGFTQRARKTLIRGLNFLFRAYIK